MTKEADWYIYQHMDSTAKFFILIGILFILIGGAWHFGWVQALRLGRLPGDIYIEKENMKVFIPITTGLLISLIWSLGVWLWRQI